MQDAAICQRALITVALTNARTTTTDHIQAELKEVMDKLAALDADLQGKKSRKEQLEHDVSNTLLTDSFMLCLCAS